MRCSGPWDWNLKNDNKCQKIWKKLQVLSKNAKIHNSKVENQTFINRNYAVVYYQVLYQTLEEVSLHLGLKNSKNDKNFQKNLKIAKISTNLCVCVCSTNTYSS